MAEVTQPHLRGILYSTCDICSTIGSLCQCLLCTFLSWRQAIFINCIIPIICLLLVSLIPESPVWLLTHSKTEEAEESLASLRGWANKEYIEEEFEEMSLIVFRKCFENVDQAKSIPKTINSSKKKRYYWPPFLLLFVYLLKSFCGVSCISMYAIPIYITIKVPINEYHVTLIQSAVEIIGCILSTIYIHVLGKRVIMFISLIGTAICLCVVTIYICTKDIFYLILIRNQEESH